MKSVQAQGKRKRAVARAVLTKGTGKVTINGISLQNWSDSLSRLRVIEPFRIAGNAADKVNVSVTVNGGGVNGQSDAVRLAVARALVAHDGKLKQSFDDYDRLLLVADVRRKEVCKPNDSKARAKRQKSYRKEANDTMIIPIRCFSCAKPVGHLWDKFKEQAEKGSDKKKILDSIGLERYCCRGLFMGHVDLINIAGEFRKG